MSSPSLIWYSSSAFKKWEWTFPFRQITGKYSLEYSKGRVASFDTRTNILESFFTSLNYNNNCSRTIQLTLRPSSHNPTLLETLSRIRTFFDRQSGCRSWSISHNLVSQSLSLLSNLHDQEYKQLLFPLPPLTGVPNFQYAIVFNSHFELESIDLFIFSLMLSAILSMISSLSPFTVDVKWKLSL